MRCPNLIGFQSRWYPGVLLQGASGIVVRLRVAHAVDAAATRRRHGVEPERGTNETW